MLKIRKKIVDDIVNHAREESPIEACGYLAEKDGAVVAAFRLTNADAAEDHFTLKPEEQFATVKQMRAEGLRLRAIYHSHPVTGARPSEEDIRLAYDPAISYVIVSLAGQGEAVRSFRIIASVAEAEEMEILD